MKRFYMVLIAVLAFVLVGDATLRGGAARSLLAVTPNPAVVVIDQGQVVTDGTPINYYVLWDSISETCWLSNGTSVDVVPISVCTARGTPSATTTPIPAATATWTPTSTPTFTPNPPTPTNTPTATPVPPTSTPVTPTPAGAFWRPAMVTSWHWMIDHPIDVTNAKDMGLVTPAGVVLTATPPQVYDIDGFMNGQDPNCNIKDKNGVCVQGSNDAVAQLHAMGKKVICYVDLGVYENYREDAYKFPASVIGNADPGWAGSYWLDVRQTTILMPIMRARIQMCKDKGYDAVEPDEIDGYSNNPGFPITYQDQLVYNRMLASTAHQIGISILLKGDIDQAKDLVNDFDFTLNEECAQYNECNLLNVFTAAGKPVLQAEYKGTLASFCPAANTANRNAVKFPLNLNGGRQPCR